MSTSRAARCRYTRTRVQEYFHSSQHPPIIFSDFFPGFCCTALLPGSINRANHDKYDCFIFVVFGACVRLRACVGMFCFMLIFCFSFFSFFGCSGRGSGRTEPFPVPGFQGPAPDPRRSRNERFSVGASHRDARAGEGASEGVAHHSGGEHRCHRRYPRRAEVRYHVIL